MFYFEKLKGIEMIIFYRMIMRILIFFGMEIFGKSLINFYVIIKKYFYVVVFRYSYIYMEKSVIYYF